jgi:hypothetical protein
MAGTILTDSHRTARKGHDCTLCLRPIEAGTRYRYYTYAGDGTVWTHREHLPCADLFYGEWFTDEHDAPDPDELIAALAERAEATR